MQTSVLLDAATGRPVVSRDLRELLEARDIGHVAALLELARLRPGLVNAERNPPLYMDVSNAYSGDELGLPWRDAMGEGVVLAGDLAVSAHAGANSVDVAKGSAWVVGDTNPDLQPTYRVYNDAIVNLGINPDPTNPRRVLVGAQLTDQGFAGTGRLWALQALHGTAAATPALPATPASFLPLADVTVPAAAASSAAYTITDLRGRARLGGGQALASGGLVTIVDYVAGAAVATIDTNTLLGGNIPQTYKHLRLTMSMRSAAVLTTDELKLNVNNDGTNAYRWASTYSSIITPGNGPQGSNSDSRIPLAAGSLPAANATAGNYGAVVIDIPDYTSTAINKQLTWLFFGYAASQGIALFGGGQWVNTAAITRLAVAASNGSIATGSRFTLQGVI